MGLVNPAQTGQDWRPHGGRRPNIARDFHSHRRRADRRQVAHGHIYLRFFFLVLLVVQRGIAGVSVRKFHPAIHTVLGILSCVVACSMFVSLVILGLIIPQGAALLSVAMLVLVVYLTTWD